MLSTNENTTITSVGDSLEEKRRKNLLDNQQFLQNLKLINVRDELKSSVNSANPPRKKRTPKEKLNDAEIRRSSRIRSTSHPVYYGDSDDDRKFVVPDDETPEEDDDDLDSAFNKKIDQDWKPTSRVFSDEASKKKERPPRRGAARIFLPNIGLKASTIEAVNDLRKTSVSKKVNVAISSSSNEENE